MDPSVVPAAAAEVVLAGTRKTWVAEELLALRTKALFELGSLERRRLAIVAGPEPTTVLTMLTTPSTPSVSARRSWWW